jgi:hypothetical protein
MKLKSLFLEPRRMEKEEKGCSMIAPRQRSIIYFGADE